MQKIVLKAKNSHNQGVALFQPCKNPKGGFFGVERLSAREKEERPLYITEETVVKIKHNTTIDLADPWMKLCWGFLQHDPRIARDEAACRNNPYALFYIDDPEAVLDKTLSVQRQKIDLSVWILSLVPEQRHEVAALIGYKTSGNSDKQVTNFLLTKTEGADWGKIKEAKSWWDSGYAKSIQFMHALVEKGILKKDDLNQLYYYGHPRTYIGRSREEVISYLESERNTEVLRQFSAMLSIAQASDTPLTYVNDTPSARTDAYGYSLSQQSVQTPVAPPAPKSDLLEQMAQQLSQLSAQMQGISIKTVAPLSTAAAASVEELKDAIAKRKRGRPRKTHPSDTDSQTTLQGMKVNMSDLTEAGQLQVDGEFVPVGEAQSDSLSENLM